MAYDHDVQKTGPDEYRLSWRIDRKYRTSRLRFPATYQCHTDTAGAKRFAKKWNLGEIEDDAPKTDA